MNIRFIYSAAVTLALAGSSYFGAAAADGLAANQAAGNSSIRENSKDELLARVLKEFVSMLEKATHNHNIAAGLLNSAANDGLQNQVRLLTNWQAKYKELSVHLLHLPTLESLNSMMTNAADKAVSAKLLAGSYRQAVTVTRDVDDLVAVTKAVEPSLAEFATKSRSFIFNIVEEFFQRRIRQLEDSTSAAGPAPTQGTVPMRPNTLGSSSEPGGSNEQPSDEFFTWTDKQHRRIEARLMKYAGGIATLETRDGMAMTLPLVSLSEQDQKRVDPGFDPVAPARKQSAPQSSSRSAYDSRRRMRDWSEEQSGRAGAMGLPPGFCAR